MMISAIRWSAVVATAVAVAFVGMQTLVRSSDGPSPGPGPAPSARPATGDDGRRADPPRQEAKAPARKSEFPHAVKFEQGATRFLEGDRIAILEVRGTAETFAPGNIYWIKGAYTLASRDRAMVAAYTTAAKSEHGRGEYLKVQTTFVDRGDGTFTLFLPMYHEGWPHVSFYPADGGESFGGNYFGTGDFVLKEWWGSRKSH